MRLPRDAIVVGLVAVLSSGACGGAEPEVICERPEDGARLCVYAGDDSAEGRLMTADDERKAVLGSYCWEVEQGLTECGDIGEIPMLGPPLIVGRGSSVEMVTDADRLWVAINTLDAGTGSRVLERIAELTFRSGSTIIDVAPGRYVVSVFGRWGGQDAELFFPISVT